MNPDMKDQLRLNLIALPRMLSARFMGLCALALGFWLYIPPDQQQTIMDHLPVPRWALPLIVTLIGWTVRIWPQVGLQQPAPAAPSTPPEPPAPTTATAAPAAEAVEATPEAAYVKALKILYPDMTDKSLSRVAALAQALGKP